MLASKISLLLSLIGLHKKNAKVIYEANTLSEEHKQGARLGRFSYITSPYGIKFTLLFVPENTLPFNLHQDNNFCPTGAYMRGIHNEKPAQKLGFN